MKSGELLPLPDGPITAAASPGERSNDTCDSTRSGPRAVWYSFDSSLTCSNRTFFPRGNGGDLVVHLDQPVGRSRDAVALADAGERPGRQAIQRGAVPVEREQRVRERLRRIGRHQQAA